MDSSKDPRTYAIIGAAMEVHSILGPGFLEPVYQEALAVELGLRNIPHERHPHVPVHYKEAQLKTAYEPDFLCYDSVVVELKAIRRLRDIERAITINYLKATNLRVGLLLNFGASSLEHERFVNTPRKSA